MLKDTILNDLKNCHSEEEVYLLFKRHTFPGLNDTKFSDIILQAPTSTGEYSTIKLVLEGVPLLALKTILLLKLHGHIDLVPLNSGKFSYITSLQRILFGISTPCIERMDMITLGDLDDYVKSRVDQVTASTITNELYRLDEWITLANDLLPYFLRINENLSNRTNTISKVFEEARLQNIHYKTGVGGSSNKLHPLDETKKTMEKALNYIENYSTEILAISSIYVETKTMSDTLAQNHMIKSIRAHPYAFIEPDLQSLEYECQNNSKKVRAPVLRVLEAIKRLEGACVFVGLTLTGLRVSEFVTLPRFPEFRHDEHEYLTRLVKKTAVDNDGEYIEMPIPVSGKLAIQTLSKLASIRDGKQTGNLVISAFDREIMNVKSASSRVSLSISNFCNYYSLKSPSSHKLRHTMAFIIVYLSEGSGLELAKLFLGHKSITMTLRYLGHYNQVYRQAMIELEQEDSARFAKIIADERRKGNKLYGKKGEYITHQAQFQGIYAEEFSDLLEISLVELAKRNQIVILQTPVCYCIHEKSNTSIMACQRGLNLDNLESSAEFLPLTGRCKPEACSNACFTEEDVQRAQARMLVDSIPEELRERLSKNIYIVNDGGLDEMKTPLQKIIDEYNYDQYNQGKGA